jgi:hypothetical protein
VKANQPTVCIFETEHFESVYVHIRILDAQGLSLAVFVTSPVEKALRELLKEDAERIQWFVKPEKMSMPKFILRTAVYTRKCRVPFFFLHTVSSNYILWAAVASLLKETRFYLTIHDVNSMFASKPSLDLRKQMHHIGKKWLIRSVSAYVMLSRNASNYLRSIALPDKQIYYLPAALFEKKNSGNDIDLSLSTINIAVPGTVDPRRRDYRQVLELARLISEKKLPITITICGGMSKSDHPNLSAELLHASDQYPLLHIYDEPFVSVSDLEQTLRNAHFIWLPSKVYFKDSMGEKETYGISKNSGVVNDAIRIGTPMILPEGFSIEEGQETSVFRYQNASEILSFLNGITMDPDKYHSLIENAQSFSREFTLAAMQPLLKKMLT